MLSSDIYFCFLLSYTDHRVTCASSGKHKNKEDQDTLDRPSSPNVGGSGRGLSGSASPDFLLFIQFRGRTHGHMCFFRVL